MSEPRSLVSTNFAEAPDPLTGEVNASTGRRWPVEWLLLAVVVVAVVLIRVRFLSLPLERDEGEYAYGGQLLRHGGALYRDLHSMKWPGIYVAYALIFSVFGESRMAIHLGLLLLNLVSGLGVYLLAREFLSRRFAAFSAAAFLVLTVLPATQGIIANAEHFAMAFPLFGWWLLSRSLRERENLGVLVSGSLLGLGPVMKQHSLFFVVLGGVLSLLSPWPGDRRQIFRQVQTAGIYSCGVFLIWFLMIAAVWQQGVWDDFWVWTITYPTDYTSQIPLEYASVYLWYNASPIMVVVWPLLLLSLIGLIEAWRTHDFNVRLWTIGLLLAGVASVVPGFYFRTHYFLLMMPAISILAGFGLRSVGRSLSARLGRLSPALSGVLAGAALGIPLGLQSDLLVLRSLREVSRSMYQMNPFVESPRIAKYLQDHMAPEDRMVIFGSEPQLCFESGRRLAGGFVYMYPMMEDHPLVETMQQQMIEEVIEAQPEYAVKVAIHSSWLGTSRSNPMLAEWMNEYLTENYVPCGIVRIVSPEKSEYLFAEESESIDLSQFDSEEVPNRVVIYRRKSDAAFSGLTGTGLEKAIMARANVDGHFWPEAKGF